MNEKLGSKTLHARSSATISRAGRRAIDDIAVPSCRQARREGPAPHVVLIIDGHEAESAYRTPLRERFRDEKEKCRCNVCTAGKRYLLRRWRDPANERGAVYVIPEADHASYGRPPVLTKPVNFYCPPFSQSSQPAAMESRLPRAYIGV